SFGERLHHQQVDIASPSVPANAAGFVRIVDQVLAEHVEGERASLADDRHRDIPPDRERLRSGPTCVESSEDAILKLHGQEAAVVKLTSIDAVRYLRVYLFDFTAEQPSHEVGDVDCVVNYRSAAAQRGLHKPIERAPAAVCAANCQDLSYFA